REPDRRGQDPWRQPDAALWLRREFAAPRGPARADRRLAAALQEGLHLAGEGREVGLVYEVRGVGHFDPSDVGVAGGHRLRRLLREDVGRATADDEGRAREAPDGGPEIDLTARRGRAASTTPL